MSRIIRNTFIFPWFAAIVLLPPSTWAQNSLGIELPSPASPTIKVAGPPGTYEIQFTGLLEGPQTSWLPLATVNLSGSTTTNVTDPFATGKLQRFYRTVVPTNMPSNPNPAGLAWIPPGTFTMGSPTNEALRLDDEPQRTVTLTSGFYMSRHETTQGEYKALVGSNPSYFVPANGYTADTNRPVEQVSWSDATNYCALLTTRERDAGRLPSGWVYRLPTEAEWEYACRAGTTNAFHYGDGLYHGMENFWTYGEYNSTVGAILTNTTGIGYLGRTTTVGSYQANAFGLHDMHGNAREWCYDWYGTYPTGELINPSGPASGSERSMRGGRWNSSARYARSAYRMHSTPETKSNVVGFRPVLAPALP